MYIGLDGAMHIAEECENPKRTVPRAMVSAVAIGFTTAFAYTIAQLYALTDIDAILNTTEYVTVPIPLLHSSSFDVLNPPRYRYVPIFVLRQGLRSTTMTTAFIIIAMVMTVFILNAIQETSSRLAWSFARDNGFFFSSKFSQIHPKLQVPVWTLFLTYGILVIAGCVFVASTTGTCPTLCLRRIPSQTITNDPYLAFNALISSSIVLQELSFVIPIALLLFRKRNPKYLPLSREFSVPSAIGWAANVIVVVFGVVTTIFFNFPIFLPVTANTMSKSCPEFPTPLEASYYSTICKNIC